MTTDENKKVINAELKARLKDQNIWLHFLHLVLYGFAFGICSMILLGVVILHFLLRLLTGEPNIELQRFGKSLSVYFSEIVQFASFNTDKKPFPLSPWPSSDQVTTASAQSEEE